jgi:soluble lytic murein transglycosylase
VCVVVIACAILAATPTSLARRTLYPVSHAQDIQVSSERHGVDPLLIAAIIKCESGWDENAYSSAGAVGLMQVMPQTSSELARMGLVDSSAYDPSNLTDPATNIEYGTAYLAFLEGNLSSTDEVIAAYNAGMGKVEEWLAQPGELADNITYTETREYLRRVNDAYQGYKESYPTGLVVDQ